MGPEREFKPDVDSSLEGQLYAKLTAAEAENAQLKREIAQLHKVVEEQTQVIREQVIQEQTAVLRLSRP